MVPWRIILRVWIQLAKSWTHRLTAKLRLVLLQIIWTFGEASEFGNYNKVLNLYHEPHLQPHGTLWRAYKVETMVLQTRFVRHDFHCLLD